MIIFVEKKETIANKNTGCKVASQVLFPFWSRNTFMAPEQVKHSIN